MFFKRHNIITLNFGRSFCGKNRRGKWNEGRKSSLAHARASLAKCVFILHFLHRISYSLVGQGLMGEGFILQNPSPDGGFWEEDQRGEGSEGKNTKFVCMTRAYACVTRASIFLRGSFFQLLPKSNYLWGRLSTSFGGRWNVKVVLKSRLCGKFVWWDVYI